ncbi:hypothetical protein BAUCODRAFT_73558 [Baudoinia panamericana UAMH 10762]|uniref:Mitochondrial pyruvate carrier n=1 Tax=Baudoinia panamericana (strain UAMH 10762) TaxID=717646 RepID=M2LJZ9_BAUPA|nr:uncharacterized protein BAUCODRAFT_73558 [Baudoinia panamericana UAMH 10762]EMC94542.1 hypothetical protein BAUCODRAFT_73558 [Baudoinia panamericana UAMH 10762]
MATATRFGLRALRPQPFRTFAQRRAYASATESASAVEAPKVVEESGFTKFWNSPVGPKTVHFWAPIMKWGLVLAGAADFARPASALSIPQNAALMTTGAIWTRWCFVIKPRNLFLASVNALLACVGLTQVTRALMYQQSLKGQEGVKNELKKEGGVLEKVVTKPESVVEGVKNPK